MIRFAQVLSGLFVLILGAAGVVTIFSPTTISEPTGLNATTAYGITNLRTLGAPTLSLAIITALGALRKDWLLILPASLYFLFNASARVISTFVEGYESVMLRGLILTFTLFALSQVALHTFRRAALRGLVKNSE